MLPEISSLRKLENLFQSNTPHSMKLTRFWLPVLIALTLLTVPAWSMGDSLSPLETVKTLLNTIKKIENGDKLTDKQQTANKKNSEKAVTILDVELVSQKTLGKYWKKRTEKEQGKFVTILGELFEWVAFPNSAKFFSELKLEYGKTIEKKGLATVPLKVIHKEEGEVQIDFVLRKNSNRWRVVDVVLDGVSMRSNLRTQFYKVLKKKNYPELVRRMLKKLEEAKG